MTPHPVAIGLSLCDYFLVEERTRKVSLINLFTSMPLTQFPAVASPFSVVAVLTDGLGDGIIEVSVTRLDTGEEVYTHQGAIHFPHALQEVICHLRLRNCIFPAPGLYQFSLLVDGSWVAHRRLQVSQRQGET